VGSTGRALSKLESSAEVDLLVLGSRGYGPVRRVLLGDVAGNVIRGAACPVVAVPSGDATDQLRTSAGG
jgi:nucleotide-binding universal stress UspA family protein